MAKKKADNKNLKTPKAKKQGKATIKAGKKNNFKNLRAMCENGDKVQTFIPGFDDLIKGGFKRNSINLIAGNAGTGKTIFAAQFLINGAIKKKEPGIYITFEEKKGKFYQDMACLGYDLQKLEDEGLFVYLEYTPEQVRNVLIEGGGVIDSIIEKIKAKRLVIDSITSFSLLYDDELSRKEAALSLFELINKWGCTALLTSQNEAEREDYVKVSLEFEVDTVILIYHMKLKGERIRALEILKMRRTPHSQKTYEISIDSTGIKVSKNKMTEMSL